jgi:DNA-binding XRE family transcriptional regulator
LSETELADIIGVNGKTIIMWEKGSEIPNTDTLETIADYFYVTTDYLLSRKSPFIKLENIPLGSNLCNLRLSRKMKQNELGKLIGISEADVIDIEASRQLPSIEIAIKAADLFGVSLDYLVGRTSNNV